MSRLRRLFDGIRAYPTMVVSAVLILGLIGMSFYAIVTIPFSEAASLWSLRPQVSGDAPRFAQPTWTNLFRRDKLPETYVVRMEETEATVETINETTRLETTLLTFDYTYSRFPNEISFVFEVASGPMKPQVTLTWVRPDGEEIELFQGIPQQSQRFRISRGIGVEAAMAAVADGESESDAVAMQGEYALRVEAMLFDDQVKLGGKLVVYGEVYGIAGTDDLGRDLAVGLLWGTPIALMFGLLATIGTTVLAFVIAAIGSWYGGWVDAAIQRVTEVNMILPMLPIVMMIGKFMSSSLWVLLGVIVGLGIFSGSIKSYRAMFLQVKNAPYIEAARAYGASNTRIIFRYLIPRIVPVLIPNFILGIPRFIFLEASLAVLGLADPNLPTWGKILSDGRAALYLEHYHWVLEPAILLIITGLSFSMLGYALDRVFNPRLRGI